MNFKKSVSAIIACGMMFALVACAPESKEGNLGGKQNNEISKIDNSSIEKMFQSTPKNIKRDITDSLAVDADISVPNTNKADVIFAKYTSYNENDVKSIFFKNESPDKNVDKESNLVSYETSDSHLLIADSYFTFGHNKRFYYKYATENLKSKNDYISNFRPYSEAYSKEGLSFMDKNTAIGEINNIFNKLSIKFNEDSEVYALDYESMERQQSKSIEESKRMAESAGATYDGEADGYKVKKFSEDDEFYLMFLSSSINSIPVTQKSYSNVSSGGEREMMGSISEVYFGKDGIFNATISSMYEQQSVDESPSKLLTVEEAIDIAKADHEKVIETGKTSISKIDFEYVPVAYNNNRNEAKLVPAWSIEFTQTFESGQSADTQETLQGKRMLFINAITGEQIK